MAAVALPALVAAGCGGDDSPEVTATPAPPANPGQDRSDWPKKIVFAAVPAEQSATLRASFGT